MNGRTVLVVVVKSLELFRQQTCEGTRREERITGACFDLPREGCFHLKVVIRSRTQSSAMVNSF